MIEALDAENDELAALPTGVVLESRTEFSEHKLAELHLPELFFWHRTSAPERRLGIRSAQEVRSIGGFQKRCPGDAH